jgi:predicted transcriptional regulator
MEKRNKQQKQPSARDLGLEVKTAMLYRDLTGRMVGRALGVSQPAISNALAGRRPQLLLKVREYVMSQPLRSLD